MAEMTTNPPLTRLFHALPIIGWMAADLQAGRRNAPYWAIFNAVGLGILAVAMFGYPALIAIYLGLTFGILGFLVLLTRG